MEQQTTLPLFELTVFRDLMQLPAAKAAKKLISALERGQFFPAAQAWGRLCAALCADGFDSLADWLSHQLYFTATPFAEAVAAGRETPGMLAAARWDLAQLELLAKWQPKSALLACAPEAHKSAVAALPEWAPGNVPEEEVLLDFYRRHGAGLFARYQAFLWAGGRLIPVEKPDFVPESALWGYELQRDKVVANTRALLAGKAVNNVLLFGDPGTGKSATVKSLLGMEGMENLRLIEIKKTELGDLAELIRTLGHRPQKFILFIDDLAFDLDDSTYSLVKSVLEGGLEPRPDNVAVYATSNRRNLVRQTFSDRTGDEVDASETVQEKTSLAERFGLRIPYTALNRAEFLDMVASLAKRRGLSFDPDYLRQEAVKWEMRHSARTPRTALQFLASLHTV